ncbi:MAG: hypothetical protein PHE06_07955 [Lachnospiraceae bacterium]|nr:hypothetical protein [Lachnospiraceae bacterium]MDD3795885.1 hypothetical protein [Lachnospiraceae bacterium]
MATISKKISRIGFCKVDNDQAPIPIEYISFPDDGSTRRNMTFVKNSNQCPYLAEGKCNLGKECQIYIDAEKQIKLDISDMKF